jgi:chromosome segregation protein
VRSLKRLQLQGYKTFASLTDFVFDSGVTAIVGPNGSGKSNIADSVRWVLGEQSFGTLRGKRTEDMIFSGSEQRTRSGMAYVSVTLDNSTGWLPTEFSEVEIARRAYRSGDNEYYLNGNRVRLRDVTEVLARSGLSERTYTVIGQGLVDQALSQRPDERRRLFEEAAGITVYQNKRDQAAQKLAEAQSNLVRARDIINELTPRLRYLKGQARRVQEYQQVRRDLDAHLQVWYSHKWRQAHLALEAIRQQVADETAAVAEHGERLNHLLERESARREERAALRDQLTEWHRALSLLHRQAEEIQRKLAVRAEQARLWREQQDGIDQEVLQLRAVMEDGAERLVSAEAELTDAEAAHKTRLARVAEAEKELGDLMSEQEARAARVQKAHESVLALRSRIVETRSLLTQIDQRKLELGGAESEQAQSLAGTVRQIADLDEGIAALAGQAEGTEAELATVAQEEAGHTAALTQAQQDRQQTMAGLNQAQQDLGRLQEQYDLLSRLRDEGAGLAKGPRTIVSAKTKIAGLVGALGELIDVPSDLERAIEAALGSRLQDIVVERWENAEAAVAFLKEQHGGRATFLPLDVLRSPKAGTVPSEAGVLGLASKLVRFDDTIRPAVELALNRVLVVEDLPVARRLLRDVASRGTGLAAMVTLEGETVRVSGSVTGGSEDGRQDAGLISRSRSLRELPTKLHEAGAEVSRWETTLKATQLAEESARGELEKLRGRRGEIMNRMERLRSEQSRLQLALERARQARRWHDDRHRELTRQLAELERRESEARGAEADLVVRIREAEVGEQSAQRDLSSLPIEDLLSEVARLRGETSVVQGQLEHYRTRVDELAAQQRQRAHEVASKEERHRELARQSHEAGLAVVELEATNQHLAQQVIALTSQIDPAETRLSEIEREQRATEAQEQALREELRRSQLRHSQAELGMQRRQDEVERLRSEIEKELGLVAMNPSEGWNVEELADRQPPLPLDEMITPLQAIVELPEGLDEDVRNLRAQLVRLGPVNLDALREYEEVDARCNFLDSQASDLEGAVASLQEVIAELDRVMEREFLGTFKAVANRFREEFKELFGGGSAKLLLTDPENPNTTGIEIIARPPGKREQGLALLSGGERSLTAAALIFSILKSRPTPFCVLDEVDAMLDEANVGRFRDKLGELSRQTQFILITHNRGTIEIANTIYGVSMGGDNTSQVVSLKLEGREIVAANRAEID